MSGQNRHITGLRIGVVQRDILFHGQVQGLFLLVGRSTGILADVLARHYMLDDAEWRGRHVWPVILMRSWEKTWEEESPDSAWSIKWRRCSAALAEPRPLGSPDNRMGSTAEDPVYNPLILNNKIGEFDNVIVMIRSLDVNAMSEYFHY